MMAFVRRLAPLLFAFACTSGVPEEGAPPVENAGAERPAPTAAAPSAMPSLVAAQGGPRTCPSPGIHELPDAGGYPGIGRLVWTGDHYLQLWYERESQGRDFHLYVQRLGPNLEPLDDAPRRLFEQTPENASRGGVQVALGDGTLGLVYKHSLTEMREPAPRPRSGMPQRGSPVRTPTGPQPTLVGIETRFLRLDLDGEPLGHERAVAPGAAPWNGDHAAIAWDPETRRWGVALEGTEPGGANRRLYFAQLDQSGQLAEDPIALSEQYALGSAAQSVVARPGGGFAVVWGDRRAMLAEIGSEVRRVTLAPFSGGEPTIATDGSHYAVALAAGSPRRVHLAWAEVGGDGRPDLAQPIGMPEAYSGSPDLRYGPEGLELVYVQQGEQRLSRIHRRVLTPDGLADPTPLTESDSSRDSHGWPVYAEGDGPCPGLFTYAVFGGDHAAIRAFVPQ